MDTCRWRSYVELVEYDDLDVKRILSVSSEYVRTRAASQNGDGGSDSVTYHVFGSETRLGDRNLPNEPPEVKSEPMMPDYPEFAFDEEDNMQCFYDDYDHEYDVIDYIDVENDSPVTTAAEVKVKPEPKTPEELTKSCSKNSENGSHKGDTSSEPGSKKEISSSEAPLSPSFHRPWQLPQSPKAVAQPSATQSKSPFATVPSPPVPAVTSQKVPRLKSPEPKVKSPGPAVSSTSHASSGSRTSGGPATSMTSPPLMRAQSVSVIPPATSLTSQSASWTSPATLLSPLSRTPPSSLSAYRLSPQAFSLNALPRPESALPPTTLSPFPFHQMAPGPPLPVYPPIPVHDFPASPLRDFPPREVPGFQASGLPAVFPAPGLPPGPRMVSLVPGTGVSSAASSLATITHEQQILPNVSVVTLEHLHTLQQIHAQGIHQVFPSPFHPR